MADAAPVTEALTSFTINPETSAVNAVATELSTPLIATPFADSVIDRSTDDATSFTISASPRTAIDAFTEASTCLTGIATPATVIVAVDAPKMANVTLLFDDAVAATDTEELLSNKLRLSICSSVPKASRSSILPQLSNCSRVGPSISAIGLSRSYV